MLKAGGRSCSDATRPWPPAFRWRWSGQTPPAIHILDHAICTQACFVQANLKGSTLRKTRCHTADFTRADLENADMTGADCRCAKVKIAGKAAVTKKSEIPRSMGDEAGVNKGVVSGMNMGKITFKKASSKVKIEGDVHLTSMTAHNGMNANVPAGAQIAPSQSKVIIAP